METTKCFLCEQSASSKCESCQISFCSELHHSLHTFQGKCLPFTIKTQDIVGRCVVATRDIEAGELIFRDEAVAVGPHHDTPPLCLSCFKVLENDNYVECEDCGLPMCDQTCVSGDHQLWECKIFSKKGQPIKIKNIDGTTFHPFYQCIASLRCLLLKEKDEIKWKTLQIMMDHNNERQNQNNHHWQNCQHNIVNYLRDYWELDYSKDEINHVIGVIEVNAYEIQLSTIENDQNMTQYLGEGRGVFPLLGMLSHSCISNCKYINVDDGRRMECRATVPIKKGEQILGHYVSPMLNTQKRLSNLSNGWYFWCKCARCVDPSEAGTHMSSFLCSGLRQRLRCHNEFIKFADIGADEKSCSGVVMPCLASDLTSNYECDTCSQKYSNDIVSDLTQELENMLAMTETYDSPGLEFLLQMYETQFHPSHSVLLKIKRLLINIYGRNKETCSLEHLEKKILYCDQILATCNIVMPGLTKERGLILYEKIIALIQIGEKQPEDLVLHLQEVGKCLSFSRKGTNEDIIFDRVKTMLQYMQLDA